MRTNFLLNNIPRKLLQAAVWLKHVRSYDPSGRRMRLLRPRTVHIQTTDRCNASCIMCPYSTINSSARGNLMDDKLYRHIINEIRRAGGTGTLCLMLQNEPLLDHKLSQRIRFARESLGNNVRIMTVTNGAPLTQKMIEDLMSAGISNIAVSIDAFHKSTYEKIRQGLNFQRVIQNTLSLIEHTEPDRVSVKFLRQHENEGEEDAFARYWQDRGIRVNFIEPTNRAGMLESYERIKKRKPALWKQLIHPVLNKAIPACPLPFTSMNILWDGKAITCSEDWQPRDTVGDISKQSLGEIWNGEKINHYRHLLWTRQAAESLVCADCSLSERYWKT